MSALKILYDYPSFRQTHGGVSRYLCEIIKELDGEIEAQMSIFLTDNIYIHEIPSLKVKRLLPYKRFKGKKRIERIFNTIYSNYKLKNSNYDIFHISNPDYYSVRKIKQPIVATIHDMVNEKLTEYHISHSVQIENKKRLIFDCAHLIAVSENTKKDIIDIYAINPNKITVIHHGAPLPAKERFKNNYGRYIFYVGDRERYKNFIFFTLSIAPLLIEDRDLKLVCAGPSFTVEEEKFLVKLRVRNQVFAMRVSDSYLFSLYGNALAFVYPSRFEGFGIPILEAFANSCPVCLSNSSCFPEIAGDAALYFDPEDSESIYKSVKEIISNTSLAFELKKKGLKRLAQFSWSKAAKETLNVYNTVI